MTSTESIRRRRRTANAVPAGLLLAALLVPSGPALASGPLATFIDDRGVLHFTNRPHEPRYRRMAEIPATRRPAPTPPRGWQYDGIVLLASRQHELPPALVKAVIAAESGFNPGAVSHKGAQGLMQLMPATAASLGVEDPLRPDQNVRGGVRYLRHLLDRYGDLSLALAAYNAGPTAVDRYDGIPPYRETRAYVKRVLTYYRSYDGLSGR